MRRGSEGSRKVAIVAAVDGSSWRSRTGQTYTEWLGNGWLDAVHPDDRASAERQWRDAVAARRLVNAEFRLRAPDGGWRSHGRRKALRRARRRRGGVLEPG